FFPKEVAPGADVTTMPDPEPGTRAELPCDAPTSERLRDKLLSHVPDAIRVLFLNTFIAGWLALIDPYSFLGNLIYSQTIGFSIFVLAVAVSRLSRATRLTFRALM